LRSTSSLGNCDRRLGADKAAQLRDVGRGQAKAGRGRLTRFILGTGSWLGIKEKTGVIQSNPAGAVRVFLGPETDAFAILNAKTSATLVLILAGCLAGAARFHMVALEKLPVIEQHDGLALHWMKTEKSG
jgi:hypothetical protein